MFCRDQPDTFVVTFSVSVHNNTADLLWKIVKISIIMWVFDGIWIICSKPSFLHNRMSKLKCSLTAFLSTNTGKYKPCSLLSSTVERKLSGCLVLGWQETHMLFLSLWKTVWIPRLGSGFMVSGIDLKFTFYSKIFIFVIRRGTCQHTCVHKQLFEVHKMWCAWWCVQPCYHMLQKTCTKISNSWSPDSFYSFYTFLWHSFLSSKYWPKQRIVPNISNSWYWSLYKKIWKLLM